MLRLPFVYMYLCERMTEGERVPIGTSKYNRILRVLSLGFSVMKQKTTQE